MAASVGDALRAATEWLRASGSRSPRLDAELLMATALGVGRAELFRAPERVLTIIEERRFDGYLVRRQAREPVAYIRGRRAFRGIELEVTPAVLIPRPETETLVDVALEALAAAPAGGDAAAGALGAGPGGVAAPGFYEPLTLDVGTGSGCIALALAAENPFVRLVATDVSEAAVEVARRNAARLGLDGRVDIRVGDLLDDLLPRSVSTSSSPIRRTFPRPSTAPSKPNVRDYEPRLALDGGDDGLDVERRLIPARRRPPAPRRRAGRRGRGRAGRRRAGAFRGDRRVQTSAGARRSGRHPARRLRPSLDGRRRE